MREVRPARATPKRTTLRDTSRALSRAERERLLELAATHAGAIEADVADIIWFMAGTGVRISEALSQDWADVDLSAGTVFVRGTKTAASQCRLSMPLWLVERLAKRAADVGGTEGPLFPSPGRPASTRPRDRRNVARVFRQVLDDAGFPWATPHTLRRTVASLLDEAGHSIALAADQLGHANPAMTARFYVGRKGDMAAAAAAL